MEIQKLSIVNTIKKPEFKFHIIFLAVGTMGYLALALLTISLVFNGQIGGLWLGLGTHILAMLPLGVCLYRGERVLCRGSWRQLYRVRLALRLLCSLVGGWFLIYFACSLTSISLFIIFLVLGIALFTGNILMSILSYEFMLYLVFGVLTTVVSIGSFSLSNRLFHRLGWLVGVRTWSWFVPQTISFVLAALFAFLTNRRWVFKSRGPFWTELVSFFGSRVVSSLVLEYGGMFFFVNLLHINKDVAKIITAFAVVIANYYISKLLVFKRNREEEP
ncbi:MAG: GtrA family protein [Fastidiosipilaceae bacterium]|jgi:putative flippase GtrA|nr:hypothetical protein [Clostridiaceae bacterium]